MTLSAILQSDTRDIWAGVFLLAAALTVLTMRAFRGAEKSFEKSEEE